MKKNLALLFCLALLVSCHSQSKQIVSETPIKSNILGIELGTKVSPDDVFFTVSDEASKIFIPQNDKIGSYTDVRLIPLTMEVTYGGLSWSYIEVILDEDYNVVSIVFTSSLESIDKAEEQYFKIKSVLTQKYGKGNANGKDTVAWTDTNNMVVISYEESNALDGSDRSFCQLSYANVELSEILTEDVFNSPDV